MDNAMTADLLVTNVRPEAGPPADILIRDGRIAAIGQGLTAPGAETVDGQGAIAIAPFVEPHVHLDKILWGLPWQSITVPRQLRAMIDNAQMILGKADLHIAERYAELAPEPRVAEAIFGAVRAEYERTSRMVCKVAKIRHLLDNSPVLQKSIARRNPYVDPLSYIQIELLRRLRTAPDGPDHTALEDVILLSISGIAAGLKNTG